MANKYNKILIDMNNLYARAYFANQHLTHKVNGVEVSTGGVYSSIKMIDRLKREYLTPSGTVYLLFDNASSNVERRKDIDPEYKANRERKEESYYSALKYLQLILLSYEEGMVCVQYPEREADDLVKPILSQRTDYEYALLVSQDLDWTRSISEYVHWAKYKNDRYEIYTPESLKEELGFYPKDTKITLYKALSGDSSDNIDKPVTGMRKDLISKLVRDFSSPQELFEELNDISYISNTWRDRLKEAKSRVMLNFDLINYLNIEFEELVEYLVETTYSPSKLYSMYSILGFDARKFDSRMEEFLGKSNNSFFEFSSVDRA